MTLPVLRHGNSGSSGGSYPVDVSSQPRPAAARRGFHGIFRPGLRIIVIQPDGMEKRGLAWWGEDEESLSLDCPCDWPDLPVLLLPSPEGADWDI